MLHSVRERLAFNSNNIIITHFMSIVPTHTSDTVRSCMRWCMVTGCTVNAVELRSAVVVTLKRRGGRRCSREKYLLYNNEMYTITP